MKSIFKIFSVGSFSDGSGSRYMTTIPTHKDAVEFLDGRLGVMGGTCSWDKEKMHYGAYWIRKEKTSKKEWEKLNNEYIRYKTLKECLTEDDIDLIIQFNR